MSRQHHQHRPITTVRVNAPTVTFHSAINVAGATASVVVNGEGSAASSPSTNSAEEVPSSIDMEPDDGDDMTKEKNRLASFFNHNWPVSFLSPRVMAENGFHYLGRSDEVRCAFCKVEVMNWVRGDDPANDHRRWAPQCPFVRGEITTSVPSPDEGEARKKACIERILLERNPFHERYILETDRLDSFKEWPRAMPQRPENLAEAGFFYTGLSDKTKCFYCNIGLKDWTTEDDPWDIHAISKSTCTYVKLMKGEHFINEAKHRIQQRCLPLKFRDSKKKSPVVTSPTNSSKEVASKVSSSPVTMEDSKLCKICYEEDRNACFVPCGHVLACLKCALSVLKCPVCRNKGGAVIQIYFS